MPSSQNKRWQLVYSLVVFVIILFRFLNIAFLNYGQGILSSSFTQVYYYILLAATVGIGFFLIVDFTKFISKSSPISFGFIAEDNQLKPLAKPRTNMFIRILPHLGLVVLFTVGAVGLKSAIIPVPEAFNEATLSSVTEYDKIMYQSIDPGFGEEAIGHVIVCILVLIFTLLLNKLLKLKPVVAHWISVFLSCGIWARIFVLGHTVSYGLNESAKISAFIFEFLVQLVNQMTGIFMSWLPHVAHNFVVLRFAYTIILSIGAFQLGILPIWRILCQQDRKQKSY